ncbi:MAG: hypothetical protein R2706_01815 [Acidimicrobiales bacterium]
MRPPATELVESGTFTRLDDELRPNSHLKLSDPADVARVEERTFICVDNEADVGPTNNWRSPTDMKEELLGSTRARCGRTMYVVPFSGWACSAPRSPTSVYSSPTRPTWRCRCAS